MPTILIPTANIFYVYVLIMGKKPVCHAYIQKQETDNLKVYLNNEDCFSLEFGAANL